MYTYIRRHEHSNRIAGAHTKMHTLNRISNKGDLFCSLLGRHQHINTRYSRFSI